MASEKRTKQIGIHVTSETYDELQKIAQKQKWTVSQTVNIILEQFVRDQHEIRL